APRLNPWATARHRAAPSGARGLHPVPVSGKRTAHLGLTNRRAMSGKGDDLSALRADEGMAMRGPALYFALLTVPLVPLCGSAGAFRRSPDPQAAAASLPTLAQPAGARL